MTEILGAEFYEFYDVVSLARNLLGNYITTTQSGIETTGMIVETEAYSGKEDKACHARVGRTARTATLYGPPGTGYVFLCYGIHQMFNIVTNKEGIPDAILIRAVQPVAGIETMLQRRCLKNISYKLTAGPGCLTSALGIDASMNGQPLIPPNEIWIETRSQISNNFEVHCSPRIGVQYAGKDARLPWRFYIKDNPWVSKVKIPLSST